MIVRPTAVSRPAIGSSVGSAWGRGAPDDDVRDEVHAGQHAGPGEPGRHQHVRERDRRRRERREGDEAGEDQVEQLAVARAHYP